MATAAYLLRLSTRNSTSTPVGSVPRRCCVMVKNSNVALQSGRLTCPRWHANGPE